MAQSDVSEGRLMSVLGGVPVCNDWPSSSLRTSARTLPHLQRSHRAADARHEHKHRAIPNDLQFSHVRGHRAVRASYPSLIDLAQRGGQRDIVEDLGYFLEKPGLMRREPHLVVMHSPTGESARERQHHSALLVHEFRPLGVSTGIFAPTDRSGRGVLLGSATDRVCLALRAADQLLRRGARLVMMTVQSDATPQDADTWGRPLPGVQWAIRTRSQPSHLRLGKSYDDTLAMLGKKTRVNLRYYRRRAEAELNCSFHREVRITIEDLMAFNRESSFPMAQNVLQWRHKVQSDLKSPYMMGLKDGQGRWLSLLAGRRFGNSTEILWQINRMGLPRHSVVTAMRSYHLEHEIAQGMERLYAEGGTNHSMQNSFATEPATDIIMIRGGLKSGFSRFARRYVPSDNLLAEMLNDPNSKWHHA